MNSFNYKTTKRLIKKSHFYNPDPLYKIYTNENDIGARYSIRCINSSEVIFSLHINDLLQITVLVDDGIFYSFNLEDIKSYHLSLTDSDLSFQLKIVNSTEYLKILHLSYMTLKYIFKKYKKGCFK